MDFLYIQQEFLTITLQLHHKILKVMGSIIALKSDIENRYIFLAMTNWPINISVKLWEEQRRTVLI